MCVCGVYVWCASGAHDVYGQHTHTINTHAHTHTHTHTCAHTTHTRTHTHTHTPQHTQSHPHTTHTYVAALQSVFPQTELGTFMALSKLDKEKQLMELTSIVTGIRLFNRDCGKGGEGIDNCELTTRLSSHVRTHSDVASFPGLLHLQFLIAGNEHVYIHTR